MINPYLEDIGIHIINMDTSVHEHVVLNEDGSFSIFINARLNWEAQMLAYRHALFHIANDDFYKSDVDKIEYEAHGCCTGAT